MEIKGKVAIVTGASSGIGKATSLKLAASGAKLALVARTEEKLEKIKLEVLNLGAEAVSIPADVTDNGDVEEMVKKVVEKYGRVDILVNSAFWGPPGSLEQTTEEFWDHTLDTTLKAPFLCTRAVVPYMRKQGGGRIVNIGSLAGKVGEDNRTAYCAAKWGLEGLSAALREELTRDNIHVHLISPAATNTPFWPDSGAKLTPEILARFVPPETIADAVAWVIQQPDQVHIPDVPVYNFRNPFEGKSSPFAD
ncbi:MAG: SDR family oxidoreductase [Pelolinea sp.]|nr:SDR family oxidoreductase [Pelolinea sp.]